MNNPNLNHLDNFPFQNMDEFRNAFKTGIAEPIVPISFAKAWAIKGSDSSILLKTTIFGSLIPLVLLVGLVYFSIKSESIQWFHSIGSVLATTIVFFIIHKRFSLVVNLLFAAVAVGFLFKLNHSTAYLVAMSYFIPFSMAINERFLLEGIVDKILIDADFTSHLWNDGVLAIRYTNGDIKRKRN